MSEIDWCKNAMWDYGLTRKEARTYYAVQITGLSKGDYAKSLNVSKTLINDRLKVCNSKFERGLLRD